MQAISPTKLVRLSAAKKSVASAVQVASALMRRLGAVRGRSEDPGVTIIEPYGMGDAVSLQPLVEGLLEASVRVTICMRSAWRELFPSTVEWLDCRVPWSAYGDAEKYRVRSLLGAPFRRFVGDLRSRAGGGIGIDTRGDARNILLLSLAGCREILSLDHYLACDLATPPWAARLVPYDHRLRRWQLNAHFLEALGESSGGEPQRPRLRGRFDLPPPPAGPATVGLIPLAPWAGKRWPTGHWTELIHHLRADGVPTVGLCGPGQEAELTGQLGGDVSFRVCHSLREWAEALASVGRLVAVDTGPMHLADALDVPLVALYGASCLPLWAPSGPRSLALHCQDHPDYEPVHPTDAGVPRGQELMARHTVEAVLTALETVSAPAPAKLIAP